jgi:hypothetical protein
MKTELFLLHRTVRVVVATALLVLVAGTRHSPAQSLTNDLVSHWPLDVVQGTKTPDVVSGYDMDLNNLTTNDVVAGAVSNSFSFSNARRTLLSRVHASSDNLPINKHPAFTISLWINAVGMGQTDLRFFSEGNTGVSDPLFNLGTHSTAADNSVDVFIRQGGDEVPHLRTTGQPLDGTWHHFAFVQNPDGTRAIYIDGMLDPLAIPLRREGIVWNFNDTTIGGILRASASHWITGLIDEVALWKRALSEAEINDVKMNGVPRIGVVLPLEVRSFAADFGAVVQGDRVTLRWDASPNATLSISPGIGDVTSRSQFGVGSIETTINQDTTFTLTATRGAETITTQAVVRVVTGVAPNWRLVENFELLRAGQIRGQGNWLNPEGIFSVVAAENNQVLGYSSGDDLAAIRLNSLTVSEGRSNTLFFRTYVADTASTIGINLGLTERPIRFNDDFAGNNGPYVRIDRSGTTMASVSARNGVGGAYTAMPDVITPGKVYNVWVDAENRPFDVVGGVQMGGDRYSVHIAEEGTATRTTLFADFAADRDAVVFDPALGTPSTNLIYVFLSALDAGQGVNQVLFDDFYLSSSGFNSTVPVPARAFQIPLRISGGMFDMAAGFSFTWNATAGRTYTVNMKAALSDPWTQVATGYPVGGATGNTATFTHLDAVFLPQAFYQVIEEPVP